MEREAQVIVQEKEALRRTKELEATDVATATAGRQTAIIDAEAAKQKRILDADAEAEYLKRTAQAKRDAATLEGEGEANRRKAVLDRISIVDVGGNGQGLAKISGMAPQFVFQVLAQLEALGIDVKGLLKLLKIDPSGIETLLAGVKPDVAAAPAPPQEDV